MQIYDKAAYKTAKGFTMIEVLIAVLVLSIGLLGLASLQAASLKNNYSSYMRTQAVIFANDMVDRIRANPVAAASSTAYNNVSPSSMPSSDPGCTSGACTPADIAKHDIYQWYTNLSNTAAGTGLPGGTGTVIGDGIQFTVTVMWDDEKTGASGTNCGGNPAVDLTCFAVNFKL